MLQIYTCHVINGLLHDTLRDCYKLLTYWMLAGIGYENFLKIGTANCKYNFMRMQQFSITS